MGLGFAQKLIYVFRCCGACMARGGAGMGELGIALSLPLDLFFTPIVSDG